MIRELSRKIWGRHQRASAKLSVACVMRWALNEGHLNSYLTEGCGRSFLMRLS